MTGEWRELFGVPLVIAGLGLAATLFGLATGAPPRDMAILFVAVASPFPVIEGAMYVSVFAHEMAHAVAAWVFGLRVLQIRVCNVRWVSEGEGEAEWNGGGGVIAESTLATDRPWPATIISLAGPAADLAVVASVLLFARHIPLPASAPWWSLAFWSARGAYVSLVPSASGDQDSDIKHILDHWSPEPQIFAHHALNRIWPILEGADPTGVAPEDVRRALTHANPQWRLYAAQIATYHAIAVASPEAVERGRLYIARCRETISAAETEEQRSPFQRLLQDALLETAFAATLGGDLGAALSTEAELTVVDACNWHTARRLDGALARSQNDPLYESRLEKAWTMLETEKGAQPSPMWDTAERFLALVGEGTRIPRSPS